MSFRDQKKYLETLQRFERKMDPKEKEELKMFLKRYKDEEEFDTLSMQRLKELHDKYNITIDRSKYDSFFKKNND